MKKLLVLVLLLIGFSAKAQEDYLLQSRIIIFRGHFYEPLNARVIIQRPPRPRVNTPTTCRKCIRQHRKHGILRQSYRSLHQPTQRRNSR